MMFVYENSEWKGEADSWIWEYEPTWDGWVEYKFRNHQNIDNTQDMKMNKMTCREIIDTQELLPWALRSSFLRSVRGKVRIRDWKGRVSEMGCKPGWNTITEAVFQKVIDCVTSWYGVKMKTQNSLLCLVTWIIDSVKWWRLKGNREIEW